MTTQSEADTIMLSIYAAMRSSGYADPIVIDAEDTDVYIQAAATGVSHQIPGILCKKRRSSFSFSGACALKRLLNVIPFHALTGCDASCDANSCFFGHGKISLYEKLSRSAEACRLISKCGKILH